MNDSSDSLRTLSDFDTSKTAFNSDSPGVRMLKSVSPIHFIALIVFIGVVVALLVIVKRKFIKYASFYIVRRDYLRLNAVPKVSKENQEEICTSNRKTSIKEKVQEYSRQCMQNMLKFHPLSQVILYKVKGYMRLPSSINVLVFIVSLILTLTISLLLSQINSTFCDQSRFYSTFAYTCSLQSQPYSTDSMTQLGLSALTALLTLTLTMPIYHLISKDYFRFLQRLLSTTNLGDKHQKTLVSYPDQPHPTLQNMLGEDLSEQFTRKSLKPQQVKSNKSLFQINEDEEEEPFSPQKQQPQHEIHIEDMNQMPRVLGENQLIMNKSYGELRPPRTADGDYHINDPPQFSSYQKENQINDQEFRDYTHKPLQNTYSSGNLPHKGLKSQLGVQLPRPHSTIRPNRYGSNQNFNSQAALTDSTNLQDMAVHEQSRQHLENNGSYNQLNIDVIEEEKPEITRLRSSQNNNNSMMQQSMNQGADSSKVQLSQMSKEESKEADSSRVFMMSQSRLKSDNNNSNAQKKANAQDTIELTSQSRIVKVSLLILILACLLTLSILYCVYQLYNLTSTALLNALTIFGIALTLDLLAFRPLTILTISIFTTRTQVKSQTKITKLPIDEEEIHLLGLIYEDYELPMNQHFNHQLQPSLHNNSSVLVNHYSSQRHMVDMSGNYDTSRNQLQPHDLELQTQQQRQNQTSRIIAVKGKRRGYNGELMLVESTYFYHQKDGFETRKANISDQVDSEDSKHVRKSMEPRKKSVLHEKVDISGSLVFNAVEEQRFRKAHTQGLHLNHDDSNYDIEEIPIHSSRHQHLQDSNMIPQIQSFETPKGLNHSRIIFNMPVQPGGLNASQQIVTFQEGRESQKDQTFLLKDLVGSGSSKKQGSLKKNQEYQSLQRYLNEDKENCNSINKRGSQMRESVTSSIRQQKYLVDNQQSITSPMGEIQLHPMEEHIQFAAQYSSLQKQGSSKEGNHNIRRSQDQNFSDLKQVNLISHLQESNKAKKSRKNSTISKHVMTGSKHSSLLKANLMRSARRSMGFSPSSIKENLEQRMVQTKEENLHFSIKQQSQIQRSIQPNISPFNEHKMNIMCEEPSFIEAPTMNMPSPREFNMLNSVDFGEQVIDKAGDECEDDNYSMMKHQEPQVRESCSKNIRQFLQPQLAQRKSREKQTSKERHMNIFSDSGNNDYTQDLKPTNLLNPNAKMVKPQIKAKDKRRGKKHQRKESQVTYQTDNHSKHGTTSQQDLPIIDADDQLITCQRVNESRNDETSRSKIFEDSDASTFRMINFTGGLASRQRSKANLHQSQYQTKAHTTEGSSTPAAPIDFYSNSNTQRADEHGQQQYQSQDNGMIKKQQKASIVSDIIMEEGLATHQSSPDKQHPINHVIEIQDSNASFSDDADDCTDKASSQPQEDFQSITQPQGFTVLQRFDTDQDRQAAYSRGSADSDSFDLQEHLNSNLASKLTNRRSMAKNYKSSHQQQRKRGVSNNNFDTQSVSKPFDDTKRQKEDQEMLMLRIEEQRRKLKHFLKLARQLKSSKDEKKIKEFLRYLKEAQKPLAYSKINELKQLEIMSSPYNQSLIDMIKHEYDQYQRGGKKVSAKDGNKPPSKSQIRNDAKNGQLISKLNGIYGQQYQSSSRRPSSREMSAGPQYRSNMTASQSELGGNLIKSKLRKRDNDTKSKNSQSSLDMPVSTMFKKRKHQRNNNEPLIVQDATVNSSFTVANKTFKHTLESKKQDTVDQFNDMQDYYGTAADEQV